MDEEAGNTEAALQRSTVMNYGVTAPLQRYLFILLQNHYMVLSVKSSQWRGGKLENVTI